MEQPQPTRKIVIASSIPGVQDVVIEMGLDGMRQMLRAVVNRVRELEAESGLTRSRCGFCGQKAKGE